ncbi:MAG: formylglycine-generating enzyme family protein [Myxococcota bacterium]|nr:formylglycine-generating enzyme family protein [Myxococcota bacterium]MDW8363615.1 SUMF1/EgtB/PvdO family nonheme iron enzyme [Myxococcales bacterium]
MRRPGRLDAVAVLCALLATDRGRAEPVHRASPRHVERLRVPDVVWLPAGAFLRGSTEADSSEALHACALQIPPPLRGLCVEWLSAEHPRERVFTGAYGIDRTEVTRARYRRCVLDGACRPSAVPDDDPRLGDDRMPVVGVDRSDAARFCRWAGGRLPTEAEWERAARGTDGRIFPWGNRFHPRLANHAERWGLVEQGGDGFEHLAPVGSFPAAASPHGLLDVAGNAREWVADGWNPTTRPTTRVDPSTRDGSGGVVRGGSWRSPPFGLRIASRMALPPDTADVETGVRCAYDPE